MHRQRAKAAGKRQLPPRNTSNKMGLLKAALPPVRYQQQNKIYQPHRLQFIRKKCVFMLCPLDMGVQAP